MTNKIPDYLNQTLMTEEEKQSFVTFVEKWRSIAKLAIETYPKDGEILCDYPLTGDVTGKRCGTPLNRSDRICWRCGSDEWLAPQTEELKNTRQLPAVPVGSPMTRLENEEEFAEMVRKRKQAITSSIPAQASIGKQAQGGHIYCMNCSQCVSCSQCKCIRTNRNATGSTHPSRCNCTRCQNHLGVNATPASKVPPPPIIGSSAFSRKLSYKNGGLVYRSDISGKETPVSGLSDDALARIMEVSRKIDGNYHPLLKEEYERRAKDHSAVMYRQAQKIKRYEGYLKGLKSPGESWYVEPPNQEYLGKFYPSDPKMGYDTVEEKESDLATEYTGKGIVPKVEEDKG